MTHSRVRGFSLPLLVFIVAVLAAGGYWYFESHSIEPGLSSDPAPSSTKPYIDSAYGFGVLLPVSWMPYTESGLAVGRGNSIRTDTFASADPRNQHLVSFSVYAIGDLVASKDICDRITYNPAGENWKVETTNIGMHCEGESPNIVYEPSNALLGNGIKAYGITNQNPSSYLIPLRNGYGLLIEITNRSPHGSRGESLVDPLALPILESLQVEE